MKSAVIFLSLLIGISFQLQANNSHHAGEFIMMPEQEPSTFAVDFSNQHIVITQNGKTEQVSLMPLVEFENYYSAPAEKVLIPDQTSVIHISRNVFDNDDAIEVLIQAAYAMPDGYNPFVIDFILNQHGEAQLVGSTSRGTGQGSHPVFAIIDDKGYYGIYDDRRIAGNFLYPYQRLNAPPRISAAAFTNGYIVYQKTTCAYAQQQNLPIDQILQDKQQFVNRLIGPKNQALLINHTIALGRAQFIDKNASASINTTTRVVATYNDAHYNLAGIRSLMADFATCDTKAVVPILMSYLDDERSLDLPGDDYGSTTVSRLAMRMLDRLHDRKPDLLVNYSATIITKEQLFDWWQENRQHYPL